MLKENQLNSLALTLVVPVRRMLLQSAARCPAGLNPGDLGHSHRIEVLRGLPGTVLPNGVITAQEYGNQKPQNTTWLAFPLDDRVVMGTVNCVRKLGDGSYRVTKSESRNTRPVLSNLRLLEVPSEAPAQILLGIIWGRGPWPVQAIRFTAVLLHGHMDERGGRFYPDLEANVVEIEHDLQLGSLSAVEEAAGPEPQLAPKPSNSPE